MMRKYKTYENIRNKRKIAVFRPFSFVLSGLFFIALCIQAVAQPAGMRPPILKDVGIDQLLNNQVPLDLEFKDENGQTVKLAEYFKDKPVVLSLVYYNCPSL